MRTLRPLLLASLIAATFAPAAAHAQSGRPDGTVAREVLLQVQSGYTINELATQYGLTVLAQFGSRPIWRTRTAPGQTVKATVMALSADPRVVYAEAHLRQQAPEARHNVVWAIGGNDGQWAAQWAAAAMRLPQAHAHATGAGVKVAVLDSGIDLDHPTLAPRLARNAQGHVLGRDFVDADDHPAEVGGTSHAAYGHGTHVAGLVALAAPGAHLMPARVLTPEGWGNTWVLAEALAWAVDPDGDPATNDGARVINISLGGLKPTRLLSQAIGLATCDSDDDDDDGFEADELRCNLHGGAAVIAAAGNGGSAREKQYPAAEPGVDGLLAVAASRQDLRLADFSNRGKWIHIAAPGHQIMSTVPVANWASWSGTSMAAPLTAGVAALLWQQHPSWKAVDVTKRITDRSARLCQTTLRQTDALGAVTDLVPPNRPC